MKAGFMFSRTTKTSIKRLAVGSLTAIAICFVLAGAATATGFRDEKLLTRANKAMRNGDYQLAENIYREILGKDAHDKGARLGLSLALLKQRNLQAAYDNAARVILVDPLSARAHALLGSAILSGGDFRSSYEEFRTSLSLDEDDAMAVAGLAMIDFYENRLELAIRGLRHAADLDSTEPDYIFNLAQAAARTERYKEAADSYERFLSVAPKTDAERRARIRGLIDFLRYLGKQSSLYVPAGASRTVVSFEAFDNRPILKVRVNGQKNPLRFVLDTGSGMSVVSEETAQRLGLRPVARGGLARAVGGGGKFEIVYGYLSSLELGEVRVENVPVYIRRFYDEKNPVDGYIGLSLISKYVAMLDYGQRTLTLVRQRLDDDAGGWATIDRAIASQAGNAPAVASMMQEIPLRTTCSGFLSGEVGLEGFEKPLNFIIDTGASVSVVSQKLAEFETITAYLQPSKMRVFGAAGVTENVDTVLLPKVMLGALVRERISAAVLDMEPVNETAGFTQNGILGGNFLRHFRVSFDFARGVIRLEPLDETARNEDSVKPKEM
ncbi:MAG TPA: aspartyl protease family protein [Pyrinomonadaceae bacterium]|nr:aspartyl protease family protein [Pyrinomonadaceae bacterium]